MLFVAGLPIFLVEVNYDVLGQFAVILGKVGHFQLCESFGHVDPVCCLSTCLCPVGQTQKPTRGP